MVTFRAAVASCPRKSGNHNGDNFYFNSKFITEELSASQVMLAHKKSQSGIQMYAVSDGFMAEHYSDEISLMLVRGLKKYHAKLIEDTDLSPVEVLESYNREAYSAAKRRSLTNEHRPYASAAIVYINDDSVVFTNAGNVRIYRIRNGAVEILSEEHTQARKMLELGLITPERAEGHPQRRKLTQFYGVMPEEVSFNPPVSGGKVKIGDMYVICSCGCYENVSETRMAEICEETDNAAGFVKKVFAEAVSCGCRDDITVLAIKAEDPDEAIIGGATVSHTVSARSDEHPARNSSRVAGAGVAGIKSSEDIKNAAKVNATGSRTTGSAGVSGAAVASNSRRYRTTDVDNINDSRVRKDTRSNTPRENDESASVEKRSAMDSIKAFLGIGAANGNEQIWPALIVFAICLALVIILAIYGINVYNKYKDDKNSPHDDQSFGTTDVSQTTNPPSSTDDSNASNGGTTPDSQNQGGNMSTSNSSTSTTAQNTTSTLTAKPTGTSIGTSSEEPTATPTEPTATPTEPVATPTEPAATPTEPAATPTEPAATPTEPAATPTEPAATPTEPNGEVTSTPTASNEEPTPTPSESSETGGDE